MHARNRKEEKWEICFIHFPATSRSPHFDRNLKWIWIIPSMPRYFGIHLSPKYGGDPYTDCYLWLLLKLWLIPFNYFKLSIANWSLSTFNWACQIHYIKKKKKNSIEWKKLTKPIRWAKNSLRLWWGKITEQIGTSLANSDECLTFDYSVASTSCSCVRSSGVSRIKSISNSLKLIPGKLTRKSVKN